MADGYDYVRNYYKVPVKVGQRVTVNGKEGIIVRSQRGDQYIHAKGPGDKKPWNAHPTWETVYYAEDGTTVLADYREQKREAAL